MDKARIAAEAADEEIAKALEAAVKPLGGNYDLGKAKSAIATALAAGRAEVRLNHAKVATGLRSREFDKEMGLRLQKAKSDAEAMQLLQEAKAQAAKQQTGLDQQLKDIINEAKKNPGLKSRIKEAEAYADEIRDAQKKVLADANAGADLAATGVKARIAVEGIKSRL